MTQPMNRGANFHATVDLPHLAASVRAAAARICDRSKAAVGPVLSAANEPTRTAIRAEVQEALSTLADILGGTTAPGEVPAATNNTGGNQPASYRIDEAMIELSLLRRAVLEELPRQIGHELASDESVAVNEAMDLVVMRWVVAHCQQQAHEMQAANEGQNKYLSFLSHDLRGGLNGIFLMVEVLRLELAPRPELTQSLEDLEIMRRSIIETVANMDRFLYAERFRKGKVKARPNPFSLRTLLAEIGSRFVYAARDQGIELKIDLTDRADIVSDRELLALVLHGLVANAVKHTAQGSVLLGAKPQESGNGWRIEVTDSGSGIPPELLAQIHAGFQNPVPGTQDRGLGLNLASQAARLIGATLGAESTVGAGSRFWVELLRG